jgi:undecaprenyl-phosphate 4-deoxy-4-formamido-L-arabinose transferase
MTPDFSVVIPVFNEQDSLPLMFGRLYPALDSLGRSYEVIFVDDGSSDGSVDLLRATVADRPDNARALILARNVGQHLAILAAFEHVRGSRVITLDADLQNPPEEIGAVLRALDEGADYVGTIRQQREDVWWRKAASRWMNRIRELTTHIRITDQGCMLRGYDRRIIDSVNRCREVTPYVPALAFTFARHAVEIPVAHSERLAGASKYSMYRLARLNFDLMTGYSLIPLQVFSLSGIVIAAGSLVFVIYLAIRRLIIGPEAQGLFTLFGIAFFLMGCVLLGLGVVGEYVGRIFEQVRSRPRYVVSEFIVGDETAALRPAAPGTSAARAQVS